MSVVIPTGFAQFVLNYTGAYFASGRGATVLGFGGTGTPIVDADVFAGNIATQWETDIAPLMHDSITLESVYWATATQSGLVPSGVTATGNFDSCPPNSAFLVSYSTGFKGPRARGRTYWPGCVSDTTVSDFGIIQQTRMTQLETGFISFYNTLEAGGVNQVILQRDEPGQSSPPLDPPPRVIARVYSNRLATQRRRLRP